MRDLIFPATDAGVLAQVILVTIGFATAVWWLRRRPEWRLLAMGLWVSAYAAMGLRALH